MLTVSQKEQSFLKTSKISAKKSWKINKWWGPNKKGGPSKIPKLISGETIIWNWRVSHLGVKT